MFLLQSHYRSGKYHRQIHYFNKRGHLFILSIMSIFLPSPIQDQHQGRRSRHHGHRLGHGKRRSRDQQLVCADPLDPESSNPISQQVQKKHFSINLLVLPVQDQDQKQKETPQGLIEKCRLHLDIVDSVRRLNMLPHKGRDILPSHSVHRKPHGKRNVPAQCPSLYLRGQPAPFARR